MFPVRKADHGRQRAHGAGTTYLANAVTAAIIVLCNSCPAASGQDAVWGLETPDQFAVETTIRRKTTLTIGDGEPEVTEQSERLVVVYRVETLFAADTQLRARIQSAVRTDANASTTDQQQLHLLRQEALQINVDSSGKCRHIRGYENLMRTAAELRKAEGDLLKRVYPQECLMAWIERPFWLTPPAKPSETQDQWTRLDHLSLGMMGVLQTKVVCEAAAGEEGQTNVTFSGEGQLLPPPGGRDSGASSALAFRDVSATLTSFSGEGAFEQPADDSEEPARRPWFERLDLRWEVEGTAIVDSRGKATQITFAHEQQQSARLLPGYRMSRPGRRLGRPLGDPNELFNR